MTSSPKSDTPRRFSIWALLLEVVLIILGVMVALGANEWRQNRATAQRTDTALENIRLEILRNQATLQKRLPYHETLIDSLEAYLPELVNASFEDVDQERIGMPRGLRFILMYDAAWQSALSAQVLTNVDYETLIILSTIYQVQAYLGTVEARALGTMTPENLKQGNLYYAFIILRPTMYDVVGLEQNLMTLYGEALKRLNPEA